MANEAFLILKSRSKMHGILAITIIFLTSMAGAMSDKPVLVPNQTSSDAAANMTSMLFGGCVGISTLLCSQTISAYVAIKPTNCSIEMVVRGRYYASAIGKAAPLYATYLEQHPDYKGDLVLNVYAQDKTHVMTATITNADARVNYAGIAYLMEKNADYLLDSKRTDGLETPMGY